MLREAIYLKCKIFLSPLHLNTFLPIDIDHLQNDMSHGIPWMKLLSKCVETESYLPR